MTATSNSAQTLQEAFALHQANRLDEAEPLYRSLLETNPREFNVLHLLGLVCYQTGRIDEADQLMSQALRLEPRDASALSNHGLVLLRLGKADAAVRRLAEAIAIDPDARSSRANYASALNAAGRADEACEVAHRLTVEFPDFAEAFCALGQAQSLLGRHEEAAANFKHALSLASANVDTLAGLTACLFALGQPEEARNYAAQLQALAPNSLPALLLRAREFEEAKDLENALTTLDAALEFNAHSAELQIARCKLLGKLERAQEALDAADAAIAIAPGDAEAIFVRGLSLEAMLDFSGALREYQRVIEIDPRNADAHWNEGYCQLMLGQLSEGFKNYEWRWQAPSLKKKPRAFSTPLWLGQFPLAGKTILLYPEQGFGDTFLFLRYVDEVRSKGADVILEVQPGVGALLRSSYPQDHLFETGEPLPAFDAHCPYPSLPLACGTRESTIPTKIPYLFSEPARVTRWHAALGEKKGLRIGVAWSGNRSHVNDLNRSLTFEAFAHAFRADDELVCLQDEIREEDLHGLSLSRQIRVFDKAIKDFGDTAALIELVDIVVTVDTAVAHLAAAMGKPTWILLDTIADWRWQRDRTDSPWYSSVKLYRQSVPKRWKEVLESVKQDLDAFRPKRRGLLGFFSRR